MESITDSQAKELLALMREFYKDPKNIAAYNKWLEERKEKNHEAAG